MLKDNDMTTIEGGVVVVINISECNDILEEYCVLCIRKKGWSHESGNTYRR